ncbi:uncharacterized protein LOC108105944 [Drosophila eugracilis]|uniref:uncharacterized protein LOC108105944 n=1 Tax=Drosophila eugracilis TaxID=29029 RepID=UPI0007E725DC|nr:uncharacterized protein LOC108105944 [Drosophila eugracilis]
MNENRTLATRSILLECLRENATNMRVEHEDLGRRIAISLAASRKTLELIENMNVELEQMKHTIQNAINNVRRHEYCEDPCQRLLEILFLVVEKFDSDGKLNSKIVSQMYIESNDEPLAIKAIENNEQDSLTTPIDDSNADDNA